MVAETEAAVTGAVNVFVRYAWVIPLLPLVSAFFILFFGKRTPGKGSGFGIVAIGEALFRDYVLPFEAVSFVLLAALIGAIVLARKDEVAP